MLDAEYIYVMQKFCSVSNFKPKKSRVRSPDCKIFIARSSQGSKFLWDRNYRRQNSITCIRNSETWIIVGCKTSAAWVIFCDITSNTNNFMYCQILQAAEFLQHGRPHFCRMGHPWRQNFCNVRR